MVENSGLFDLN